MEQQNYQERYPVVHVCLRCDGAGVLQMGCCRSKMMVCPDCNGAGDVKELLELVEA
jgi:DnaJ-class molecular chaperone